MAEYMDALLAKTPVIGQPSYSVPRASLVCLIEDEEENDSEDGIDPDNDSKKVIEIKIRRLLSKTNAEEREAEGEGLYPEATIVGTDVDVEGEQPKSTENMEEAEEFDDKDMEEEDLEGDEEMLERLEGLQRQIADEDLDAEGIRRLIADEKLDTALGDFSNLTKAVDAKKIGGIVDNVGKFTQTLDDNRGNVDRTLKDVSELAAKLDNSADRLDGLMASAQSFLDSDFSGALEDHVGNQ